MSEYVMGHTEREHRRLALQGSIFNPGTEDLLRRAGVSTGMHVLDLGCGIGEVSAIASRLVGHQGRVTGIDLDPEALHTARALRLPNATFLQANLADFSPQPVFHAVTGRHILIHTPDAPATIQLAHRALRPGGLAIFQEYDFTVHTGSVPPCPLRDRTLTLFQSFFLQVTNANVGARLFHLLTEAGFETPECRGTYLVGGGPESPLYEWTAESLRSILPTLKTLNMLPPEPLEIETLAERLRAEAVTARASFPSPLIVEAFARKT